MLNKTQSVMGNNNRCKICNGRLSGELEDEDDFFCLGHVPFFVHLPYHFSQLAQRKAEKKYPYPHVWSELLPELTEALITEANINNIRQGYIDCLNDVAKPLVDALEAVRKFKNPPEEKSINYEFLFAIVDTALEKFEKIEI